LIKISKSDTDFKKRYPKKISIPETTKSTPKIKIKKRRRNKNTRNQNKGRGMRVKVDEPPTGSSMEELSRKRQKNVYKSVYIEPTREKPKKYRVIYKPNNTQRIPRY